MYTHLNEILFYLTQTKHEDFIKRTKFSLRLQLHFSSDMLDNYLSQLSKEGYIRSYLHPKIQLIDNLPFEPDRKIFFSISSRGLKFLKQGGYLS